MNESTSKAISVCRFPMICLIVFIHSYISEITVGDSTFSITLSEYPIYSNVSFLISRVVAHIAVPLFGLISGYLYFTNIETVFNWDLYKRKTKSRLKSIVLPYFLWNTAILLIYAIGQYLLPDIMGNSRKLIADYSLIDFLNVYWGIDEGCPMCFQLWFIRDLFIVSLLSPVIYILAKKLGYILVAAVVIFFILGLNIPIKTLDSSVISTFTVGAVLSIKKENLLLRASVLKGITILYALLVIIVMTVYNVEGTENSSLLIYCRRLSVIIGVIIFPSIISNISKRNSFLEKSSFFLYASHAFVLSCALRFCLKSVSITGDLVFTAIYLLVPTMVIVLILSLYYILNLISPRLVSILSGGR